MSKNKKTNYDIWKKQRGDWGSISPVTKVVPNKKKNLKIKHRKRLYEDD